MTESREVSPAACRCMRVLMSISLSWSGPGLLLLHPPGSGEVRGLRRRMHQQHWLTGLGLSSGTSLVTSISRYQLRIEDLTLNLSRPRPSWHWAGGGQARGGTQEHRSSAGGGQVIRSRPETQRPPGQHSCRPSCLGGDTATTGAWPRSRSRHINPLASSGPGCQGHYLTTIFIIHIHFYSCYPARLEEYLFFYLLFFFYRSLIQLLVYNNARAR